MKEDRKKESAIRNIFLYSSSKFYHQGLAVVTQVVRARLLSPELYGLWNILNIIQTYTTYLHMGSGSIMRYLIPANEAKGEVEENRKIKSSVFYGSLYPNLLVMAVLFVIALAGDYSTEARVGLVAMGIIVMLSWYHEYYLAVLRGYQNFKLISSSIFLFATVVAVLSIVLIYMLGIYGVYVTAVVSLLAVILYLRKRYPLEPGTGFPVGLFFTLVKQGFPLMVFNLIAVLMVTSGRIVVSYILGNTQLGYYAISVMVINSLVRLPRTAREVMEPRFMEDLQLNSPEENEKKYLFEPLINTAYFMPFLIGSVIFIFPVFVTLVLPKYVSGIMPTQILALGVYFLAISYVFRGIIVANNWQLPASVVMAAMLVLNVLLCFLFIRLGLGINGAAIGGSVSFFLLLLGLLLFIMRRYSFAFAEWRSYFRGMIWPFAAMCISIVLLHYVFSIIPLNEYVSSFLKLGLFYAVMSIIAVRARRSYPLLHKLSPRGIIQEL